MQMPAFGGMATDAWPWVLVAEAEGLWAAHCEAAAGLLICPLRWAAYTVARNQLPAPRRNWKLGAPGHLVRERAALQLGGRHHRFPRPGGGRIVIPYDQSGAKAHSQ